MTTDEHLDKLYEFTKSLSMELAELKSRFASCLQRLL